MHNGRFWGRHFKRVFVPHLRRLLQTLEGRLLPAFANLEDEASEIEEETYEELGRSLADPDLDPSVPVELAHDAGLDHYRGMLAVRQTLLNVFSALLYHAWEQQLLEFHRREVLHPKDQNNPAFLNLRVLRERLSDEGVEFDSFASWPTIEELRLVANTAKHAEGPSAQELKKLRPQIFENPALEGGPFQGISITPRVYSPLSGEDLFVRATDVHRYAQATILFWEELADALDET
jgi:hypothetical protein